MLKSVPILSFGSLNIDHVYQLPHIVRPGETLGASNYEIHSGGKGLNQSLAMARAGLSVFHAGRLGQDGLWLQDVLAESGVDCRYIESCEGQYTGHAMIQVAQTGPESGQNSIVLYRGANQAWRDADIEKLFAQDWQAVVCQNEMNGLETLLRCAKESGVAAIFNAAPYSDSLAHLPISLWQTLHTLIVNETEAMELAAIDNIERAFGELKARYANIRLVMTLGAEGLRASYQGQDYSLPAFPAKLLDTTAAGDTFSGYYTASILVHAPDDFEKALLQGCRAAALAVSRHGAAPSIPCIEELS